ncbi:MAG: hypothetical protein LDLANPLL_00047 [Turneriella sp.]|nr:hypothetical protein [Turneriella sp.]
MPERASAIIIRKKTAHDESLYIDTLLESGKFQPFKIPGVLKSNKRSAFFFSPGSLFDVIYTPRENGIVIPKSTELLFSPFAVSQDYALLNFVAEILKAIEMLMGVSASEDLFLLVKESLSLVANNYHDEKIVNNFYWRLLEFLGLQGEYDSTKKNAAYDLYDGFLSAEDASERIKKDSLITIEWVFSSMDLNSSYSAPTDSAEVREKIRRFLKAG